MTELELMKHAQNYIKSLAKGTNPLDNTQLPDSDIVNNVRISRCLFYVTEVLQKVIENDGKVINIKKKSDKVSFNITTEQIQQIRFSQYPISLSEFVRNINDVIDQEIYKKLTYSKVADWLITQNLLKEETDINGRTRKVVTEDSLAIGITEEFKTFNGQPRKVIVYSLDAQQFIVSSLVEIINYINSQNE